MTVNSPMLFSKR